MKTTSTTNKEKKIHRLKKLWKMQQFPPTSFPEISSAQQGEGVAAFLQGKKQREHMI
jgi:hypothetical protein